MCWVFFAAVCHQHHCVITRDQQLVEKHFFVMSLCQLNAGWHQNLTTSSLNAVQAKGRQVFEGRMLHHPVLRVATERKAPRGPEEIAALFSST